MTSRLRAAYFLVAVALLAAVTGFLAVGGRDDPRGPSIALDGVWRFHPGDNLAWSDPHGDDGSWERLAITSRASDRDLDVGLPGHLSGWRARGHSNLEGYAWYRRDVTLPEIGTLALLGPTMVDDGYEMYWNGRSVGGVGRLGKDEKVAVSRPYLVRIAPSAGPRTATLAIRAYMQPGIARDGQSGGLRSAPTLASESFGEELHRAQWLRTVAGYIVDLAEPILMLLLAGIALNCPERARCPWFSQWLAIALVATAALRVGNAVASWSDMTDFATLDRQNAVVLGPVTMLAWVAAWNEWTDGPERTWVVAASVGAWAARFLGAIMGWNGVVWASRVACLALLLVIAGRIAFRGDRRPLALTAMAAVATALFVQELSSIGVPAIWFAFNIGVSLSQYAYALTLVLLPLALTTRSRNDLIRL